MVYASTAYTSRHAECALRICFVFTVGRERSVKSAMAVLFVCTADARTIASNVREAVFVIMGGTGRCAKTAKASTYVCMGGRRNFAKNAVVLRCASTAREETIVHNAAAECAIHTPSKREATARFKAECNGGVGSVDKCVFNFLNFETHWTIFFNTFCI